VDRDIIPRIRFAPMGLLLILKAAALSLLFRDGSPSAPRGLHGLNSGGIFVTSKYLDLIF